MATFVKTGAGNWKAIIRRLGWPTSTKTFRTKRDAEDWARPTPIHSTFGNGAHRCPGSLLARTELKIFLEEWLKRIPDFRIKPGETAGVRAGVNATIYSLPLVWEVK